MILFFNRDTQTPVPQIFQPIERALASPKRPDKRAGVIRRMRRLQLNYFPLGQIGSAREDLPRPRNPFGARHMALRGT